MATQERSLTNVTCPSYGSCATLSFQIQGLYYLFCLVSAVIQTAYVVSRISRRRKRPCPSKEQLGIGEWHLLLGRIGLLILTVGTALDNLRLFTGAFTQAWPSSIWNSPDARIATVTWALDDYKGAQIQSLLWWICAFFHIVMVPLSTFSIKNLIYQGIHQAEGRYKMHFVPINKEMWFLSSTIMTLCLLVPSAYGFIVGPMQGPLEVRRLSGMNTLSSSIKSPVLHGLLAVITWQLCVIFVALFLFIIQGKSRRFENMILLLCNMFCLFLQAIANSGDGDLSALSNLSEQLAIGSQVWADSVHNNDDVLERKRQ